MTETREQLPNGWTRVTRTGFNEFFQKHVAGTWYEKRDGGAMLYDSLCVTEGKP
jgi:hypothetical protein